jgi:hypothetical protein
MTDLASFNAMVRKWADRQPTQYRRTALAFGYPCDRQTHSFDQTLEWVSKRSRKRTGEGVSESTLKRHLKVFEASDVITVERRRDGSRNKSSVYHVDFDKVIEAEAMGKQQRRRNRAENAERQAWLDSLDVEPPEDAEPLKHAGSDMDTCPACQIVPDNDNRDPWGDKKWKTHVANGGKDHWD